MQESYWGPLIRRHEDVELIVSTNVDGAKSQFAILVVCKSLLKEIQILRDCILGAVIRSKSVRSTHPNMSVQQRSAVAAEG
jgi:hypothetical protein